MAGVKQLQIMLAALSEEFDGDIVRIDIQPRQPEPGLNLNLLEITISNEMGRQHCLGTYLDARGLTNTEALRDAGQMLGEAARLWCHRNAELPPKQVLPAPSKTMGALDG